MTLSFHIPISLHHVQIRCRFLCGLFYDVIHGMMNWRGFGRKWPWSNQGNIRMFDMRGFRKSPRTTERIAIECLANTAPCSVSCPTLHLSIWLGISAAPPLLTLCDWAVFVIVGRLFLCHGWYAYARVFVGASSPWVNCNQIWTFFHQKCYHTLLLHLLADFYTCHLYVWLNTCMQVWLAHGNSRQFFF